MRDFTLTPAVCALAAIGGLCALATTPLRAQSAVGRIEGTITDSVHARPLAAATVLAVRVEPSAHSAGARTDARGRYRIDSLPAGRYMVEFASPFLDSLEITLPPRELVVEAGRAARADFALPSGATLRAAACPGLALGAGAGAVVGRVQNADDDSPLADARVVVAWQEVSVDRATLRSEAVERNGEVTTDSLGRYRVCGVPTDEWVQLQVQHAGRAGTALRVLVPDSAGVLVRRLSLSAASARPLAQQRAPSDTLPPAPLTGTASVAGVVRGVGGLPLSDAQVRLLGATAVSVTDARGRFSLGDLPSGTQVLEVRRIGYLLAQQPVELRAGLAAAQDVRLQRIIILDSVSVLARRSRYREFDEHRKRNGFGTFLTAEDIESRHPFQSSDLFRMIPGFRVTGFGLDAQVVSSRGVVFGGACAAIVVIDGMPNQDINLIHPSDIGAIESYRAGAPAPPQYGLNRCGVIVIWSKR
jgi:hypothetical protein